MAHIKECRNVDKLIRRAKLNEEDRVAAAAKDNPKAFFAHVNSRKPVKNTIGPLKDRTGSIISTDEGMANIFNEYFASVYTEEDTSEIPIVPIVYRGNNPLRKIEITVDKVKMPTITLNILAYSNTSSIHTHLTTFNTIPFMTTIISSYFLFFKLLLSYVLLLYIPHIFKHAK